MVKLVDSYPFFPFFFFAFVSRISNLKEETCFCTNIDFVYSFWEKKDWIFNAMILIIINNYSLKGQSHVL